MRMKDYLNKLIAKPERERRRITSILAVIGTVAVIILWLINFRITVLTEKRIETDSTNRSQSSGISYHIKRIKEGMKVIIYGKR